MNTRLDAGSPDRFGYSWAIFHEIHPEHLEQFLRWTAALPREAWKGARFLDAGCGNGRNSYWAMHEGAVRGLAIDVDERSLDAARKNLAHYTTVDVRNESIYDISEANAFDIVFSVGVIHHLGDPNHALEQLVKAAKPGGYVMIWVYGAENMAWLLRHFDPIRRACFNRLPLGLTYHLSFYLTIALWVSLRLRLLRLEYYRLLQKLPFRQLRVIVFDQMIPRIAHYWPRKVVERLCRDAGLEDIRLVHVNEISWSASGRKPAQAAATNPHR